MARRTRRLLNGNAKWLDLSERRPVAEVSRPDQRARIETTGADELKDIHLRDRALHLPASIVVPLGIGGLSQVLIRIFSPFGPGRGGSAGPGQIFQTRMCLCSGFELSMP